MQRILPITDIFSVVSSTLAVIPDQALALCIGDAFRSETASTRKIEVCFQRLTSSEWPQSTLRRFFSAWKDTHLSSGSVAALVCRLLAKGQSEPAKSADYTAVAMDVAQVIHEDLGLCGDTHSSLYERLANRICGGDDWKSNKYQVLEAANFRDWVHAQRVEASIEQALLTTIASEIYNHGEYTFIAPLFKSWMSSHVNLPPVQIQPSLAYILVHTGTTESDHFMHVIDALLNYYRITDSRLNYATVAQVCRNYLKELSQVFQAIDRCLAEEERVLNFAPPSHIEAMV